MHYVSGLRAWAQIATERRRRRRRRPSVRRRPSSVVVRRPSSVVVFLTSGYLTIPQYLNIYSA